jgi:hypothetical protein
MSLSDTVFDALKGLVSQRCYPDRFPQVTTPIWPAIRVTFVGGNVNEDLEGDGDENSDDPRIQIDWVAATQSERDALTPQVRAAMKAITDPPLRMQGTPMYQFDAETKTFRGTADWVAHPSTPT